MDNPESLTTLDTQDTGRRQKTLHRKLRGWATRITSKTGSESRCWRNGSSFYFLQEALLVICVFSQI